MDLQALGWWEWVLVVVTVGYRCRGGWGWGRNVGRCRCDRREKMVKLNLGTDENYHISTTFRFLPFPLPNFFFNLFVFYYSEKNKVEWRADSSCMETTIKRQNFPWQDCLVWDNINIDKTGKSSSADFRESCPLPPNSEKWNNCCRPVYDLMTSWPHACVLLNPIIQLEMLLVEWKFSTLS